MKSQKGFSLTEVLLSLLLATTLILALLQQQRQSKYLLSQLVLQTKGSQFLDQVEETLLAQVTKLPQEPSNFGLEIQRQNSKLIIQLSWLKHIGSITRKHNSIGSSE